MAEINEREREAIAKEAQELMEKFGKKLESVKLKDKKSENRVGGFREEREGSLPNEDFRKRIFMNAPEKNEDNIIAEKKKW
jgi:Asp-tRNA(Asn)/Glu-tRNA(Gln) amidotransferase C subunit